MESTLDSLELFFLQNDINLSSILLDPLQNIVHPQEKDVLSASWAKFAEELEYDRPASLSPYCFIFRKQLSAEDKETLTLSNAATSISVGISFICVPYLNFCRSLKNLRSQLTNRPYLLWNQGLPPKKVTSLLSIQQLGLYQKLMTHLTSMKLTKHRTVLPFSRTWTSIILACRLSTYPFLNYCNLPIRPSRQRLGRYVPFPDSNPTLPEYV